MLNELLKKFGFEKSVDDDELESDTTERLEKALQTIDFYQKEFPEDLENAVKDLVALGLGE